MLCVGGGGGWGWGGGGVADKHGDSNLISSASLSRIDSHSGSVYPHSGCRKIMTDIFPHHYRPIRFKHPRHFK